MNQITRWNMESDAKEIAFKNMNEDTMLSYFNTPF